MSRTCFAFIAEDLIFAFLKITLDQVTQETMQFNTGVVGAGQAAATKQQVGMLKYRPYSCTITSRRYLRCAEDRVLGLVD